MLKNKKMIGALAVVLALATLFSGTFAWFTAQSAVVNHLESGGFTAGAVKLVEVFDKDTPLDPGVEVNKDVWVVNTGGTDALVRVSFAEVLQKLVGSAGEVTVTPKNAKWTTSDLASRIVPVTYDPNTFAPSGNYGSINGWIQATTGDLQTLFGSANVTGTLDANTVVLYKEISVPVSGVGAHKSYAFVAYSTPLIDASGKYNGLNQVIDVDSYIVLEDGKLTINTPQYQTVQYSTETKARWATMTKSGTIGYTTNNIVPYQTSGTIASYFTTKTTPSASNYGQSILDSYINLLYVIGNVMTSPTADKWYYSAVDGYFYYCGVLKPGQSTPQLLDGVKLDADRGNEYSNMSYDLVVVMEAIQNIKEAVEGAESVGGFNVTSGAQSALYNVLMGQVSNP